MSAWGNKDDIASPGTVALTANSTGFINVDGTGTFFANNYAAGDVITIADAGGDAVIKSITNATHMLLVSNTEMTSGTLTGKAYTVDEKPIYVIDTDTNTTGAEVYGVSVAEQIVSNNLVTTTANTLAVAANTGAHAGWNKVTAAYTDTHGRLRVKTETLVAMGTITGDGDDDTLLPDS